jgi:hypothetical protein
MQMPVHIAIGLGKVHQYFPRFGAEPTRTSLFLARGQGGVRLACLQSARCSVAPRSADGDGVSVVADPMLWFPRFGRRVLRLMEVAPMSLSTNGPTGFAFAASVFASLCLAHFAAADMSGATVSFTGNYGAGTDPLGWRVWGAEQSITVGSGVEYQYQQFVSVDFSATQIRVDFASPTVWIGIHDFNGWVLRDTNGVLPDFLGIALIESAGTSWGPVVASVYDADTLLLNFGPTHTASGQLLFDQGDFGVFEVAFVPAPGAMLLLGTGGLFAGRRRRR